MLAHLREGPGGAPWTLAQLVSPHTPGGGGEGFVFHDTLGGVTLFFTALTSGGAGTC